MAGLFNQAAAGLATLPPPAVSTMAATGHRAKSENFTVAAVLLPPRIRRRLLSLYAFARLVDDIGDEAPGNRIALLNKVSRELDVVFAGGAVSHELYRQLRRTIRQSGIPRTPFDCLLEANRLDQHVQRYGTFDALLAYCELSANPVGHLVLHVFGAATSEYMALADRICTALQLLEHSQDVAEDLDRGRIYLPAEDLARFGVRESDLRAPCATRRVRALLAFQTQRASQLLDAGAPLVGRLHGPARLAVAGYVAGGRATAAALAAANFDVLAAHCRPRRHRTLVEWVRAVAGGANHEHR